jgi:hypothetical protein
MARPPSTVERQTLAAVWHLTLIGALRSNYEISFPFDRTWRDYAAAHRAALTTLVSHLQSFAGFDSDIADMLLRDAPWNAADGATSLVDRETLDAALALMFDRQPGALAAVKQTEPSDLYAALTVRQLAQLLDGALVSRFQGGFNIVAADASGLAKILSLGMDLAYPDSRRDPAEWLSLVWEHWNDTFRRRLEENPGNEAFASWLSRAIGELQTAWVR